MISVKLFTAVPSRWCDYGLFLFSSFSYLHFWSFPQWTDNIFVIRFLRLYKNWYQYLTVTLCFSVFQISNLIFYLWGQEGRYFHPSFIDGDSEEQRVWDVTYPRSESTARIRTQVGLLALSSDDFTWVWDRKAVGRNSQIRILETEFVKSRHHSAEGNSCPQALASWEAGRMVWGAHVLILDPQEGKEALMRNRKEWWEVLLQLGCSG